MSDVKKDFADSIELEKRKIELQKAKLTLDERRTETQLHKIEQNDKDLEIAKNTNFGSLSAEQVAKVRAENADYIAAAKTSMSFMNDEFKGIVPYFRKNLILIGGKTGEGKSTTVANIAWSTIRQRRPDGKQRRVLVITNEERTEDVYNRVTCLAKGWSYTNHDQFTDEQTETFDQWIQHLSKDGLLTVVDNNHNGALGTTTSVEGICTIFDNLIRDGEFFDVVLIDYYQNIKYSKRDPGMNEWTVQAAVCAALDQYKNVYPAPIIMMSQVNPDTEDQKTPFQFRIKGRKVIMDVSTCAIEMIADRQNYRTAWIIHKSRFNESVGKEFHTGFQRGAYVLYDEKFRMEVNRMKEARMMDKLNGMRMKQAMGDKKPTGDETKE